MGTNKLAPCCGLFSLRRRWEVVTLQNIADRLVAHRMAHILQSSDNAVIAPAAILLSEWMINFSMAELMCGRPGYCRYEEPSNFFAISFRCQTRSVSGVITDTTSAKACFPSRLPRAARVLRSPSVSRTRPVIWFRKLRFSATKYSFRNNNSWSTVPVM